jgi:hypothetical protein
VRTSMEGAMITETAGGLGGAMTGALLQMRWQVASFTVRLAGRRNVSGQVFQLDSRVARLT